MFCSFYVSHCKQICTNCVEGFKGNDVVKSLYFVNIQQ